MRGRFFALPAVVAILLAMPVAAEDLAEQTKRVGPETAVGGLTIAEQVQRSQQLNAELTAQLPAGVGDSPIVVEIDQKDRDDLAVRTPMGSAPLRIGVVKPILDLVGKPFGKAFNHGVIERSDSGNFSWGMTVNSPGAQAIRLQITGFSLPENTEMYLLGPNGQADGPYTSLGRTSTGEFWTRSIVSETVTLMLLYTGKNADVDEPTMSFAVSAVAHIGGRPLQSQERSHDSWPCSDNAPCVVDATCPGNSSPADPAKDAVAKMEWVQGPFVNTCTGGLLADTDAGSQIPYFLTANHCLTANNSSLETFFNYTTDSCNGGCPDGLVTGGTPPPSDTVGVTVVATGSVGDFTLLTLDQAPPAGATFLGWNNSPIAFSNGANLYRISNANFGPQVYSQHDVDTGAGTCTGIPRGDWIYSADQTGATMGGSSGSPVVNSAGEVVGQLTGCCGFNCGDECDSASNSTIDGAFATYWNQISQFLDPQGGCTGDAECDDGLFCTGAETCVSGACQSSGDPCGGGSVCNEATNSCDTAACDNDGSCEAGEDCNNCPNDCRQKVNGNPSSRYCCDGDLTNCGDTRCSESGWSCGGGGGCTTNGDCDDLQFCNGAETCVSGSCASGSDPCPGQGCDEGADVCVSCGGNKASCNVNGDCCSNNCKNGSCKGN